MLRGRADQVSSARLPGRGATVLSGRYARGSAASSERSGRPGRGIAACRCCDSLAWACPWDEGPGLSYLRVLKNRPTHASQHPGNRRCAAARGGGHCGRARSGGWQRAWLRRRLHPRGAGAGGLVAGLAANPGDVCEASAACGGLAPRLLDTSSPTATGASDRRCAGWRKSAARGPPPPTPTRLTTPVVLPCAIGTSSLSRSKRCGTSRAGAG